MSSTSMIDPAGSYGPGLLRSIARYKVAIAVAFLTAFAIGFFVSSWQRPVYEATATVILSDAEVFSEDVADPERKVQQEANRLTSRAVFNRAAEEFGDMSAADLVDQVTVEADPVVGLIEVTATGDDPNTAVQIANTVTQAYEEEVRQAISAQVESANEVLQAQADAVAAQINRLEAQSAREPSDAAAIQRLDALRAQLLALQTRMSEVTTDAALYGAGVEEVEEAVPPVEPSSPQPLRNAAVAGIIGLTIASALAYWRAGVVANAKLDPTTVLGAPLLAQIPDFRRSSAGGTAGDPLFDLDIAEAYQFLLSSFEFALAQTNAQSVLVTSASPGDGKSLTSLHLSRALAIQGRDVVLVDSDIRARGLTSLLSAQGQAGLVSLAEGGDINSVVRRYRITHAVQLAVIAAGRSPHQPTGLLATAKYRDAIAKITAAFELTVIDGGPLLTVADASAVATQVAGILLVLDAETSEDDLLKVQQRLRLISTPLIGYIVNRAKDSRPTSYPRVGRADTTWVRRFFSVGARSKTTEAAP